MSLRKLDYHSRHKECKHCHNVFPEEEYEKHLGLCEQKLYPVFRQKRPGEDAEEVVTKKQKIEVPWAPKLEGEGEGAEISVQAENGSR